MVLLDGATNVSEGFAIALRDDGVLASKGRRFVSEEYVKAAVIHGSQEKPRNFFTERIYRLVAESESDLLHDWWFTANPFAFATSLLRVTTSIFFSTEYLHS
jgi:hypothetical protein